MEVRCSAFTSVNEMEGIAYALVMVYVAYALASYGTYYSSGQAYLSSSAVSYASFVSASSAYSSVAFAMLHSLPIQQYEKLELALGASNISVSGNFIDIRPASGNGVYYRGIYGG